MRIPQSPPEFSDCFRSIVENDLSGRMRDPDVIDFVRSSNEKYLHWEKFRYHPVPEGFDHLSAWAVVSLSRESQSRSIPISFYDVESSLEFCSPPKHQEWLHKIDQQAGGTIGAGTRFGMPDDNEKYLINSLMEEAIASSQLEGAMTTRAIAKKLLRLKRRPKDTSQRMIMNNYLAIQELREMKHKKLTPELLCHIQSIITEDTLENPDDCGRTRKPGDENVVVEESMTGRVMHTPPSNSQVEWRVEEICDFANEESKPFIHPVLKAIALHFAIGFVHPFVDGNGRTARAVFYWYMLKKGYWVFEFLPISRIFLGAPSQYAKAYLFTETSSGDLTFFIHYHLKAIIRAIKELHDYIGTQQKALREAACILGNSPGINYRQTSLIYHAIKHTDAIYTVALHAGKHNVSKATARSDLHGLEDRGLLKKLKIGREWAFFPQNDIAKLVAKKMSD